MGNEAASAHKRVGDAPPLKIVLLTHLWAADAVALAGCSSEPYLPQWNLVRHTRMGYGHVSESGKYA